MTDHQPPGVLQYVEKIQNGWRWHYYAADGQHIGYVERTPGPDGQGKTIRPHFNRDKSGRFAPGIPKSLSPRPLYGLWTIQPGKPLLVLEGERACAAAHHLGLPAVCSLGGSQSPHLADWSPVAAAERIIILPDADEPGLEYAQKVGNLIRQRNPGMPIQVCELPDADPGGDLVDHIQLVLHNWNGFGPIDAEQAKLIRARLGKAIKAHARSFDEWMDDQWPDPLPITPPLPPAPEFNLEWMPKAVRPYLEQAAEQLQVAPDQVAVPFLVAMHSVIGLALSSKPLDSGDGGETVIVPTVAWGWIVAPSGSKKSPGAKITTNLLTALGEKLRESYNERHAKWRANYEVWETERKAISRRIKQIADELTKAPAAIREHAGDAQKLAGPGGIADTLNDLEAEKMLLQKTMQEHELKKPIEPHPRLFVITEYTYQALTQLASEKENYRGALLFHEEGRAILRHMQTDQGQHLRDAIKKAYDGGRESDLKIQRGLTEGRTLFSILLLTHPPEIAKIIDDVDDEDGIDDGLLPRFQFLAAPEWKAPRHGGSTPIDPAARRAALALLEWMATTDFGDMGLKEEDTLNPAYSKDVRRYALPFEPKAAKWHEQIKVDLERRARDVAPGDKLLAQFLLKHHQTIASIALVLHVADHCGRDYLPPVSVEALDRAVQIANHFMAHRERIYAARAAPTAARAEKIAQKIREGKLKDGFTVRDLLQKTWGGLNNAEKVRPACRHLERANILKAFPQQRKHKQSKHPAEIYKINPKILTDRTTGNGDTNDA